MSPHYHDLRHKCTAGADVQSATAGVLEEAPSVANGTHRPREAEDQVVPDDAEGDEGVPKHLQRDPDGDDRGDRVGGPDVFHGPSLPRSPLIFHRFSRKSPPGSRTGRRSTTSRWARTACRCTG